MSRTLRALFLLTLLLAAAYAAPVEENSSSLLSTGVADGEEFVSSTSSAEEGTFTTREEDYSRYRHTMNGDTWHRLREERKREKGEGDTIAEIRAFLTLVCVCSLPLTIDVTRDSGFTYLCLS